LVLAAGGLNFDGLTATAELYDPSTGHWNVTGSLNTARYVHAATLLLNGMVLVAGGLDPFGSSVSAELYNPARKTWNAVGNLDAARYQHTATLLPSGRVLVAGGVGSLNVALASAELFTLAAAGSAN
jgi:hypothetical protein